MFGLVCIDTINDSRNQKNLERAVEPDTEENVEVEDDAEKQLRKSSISCIFSGHEIQFYQVCSINVRLHMR